MTHSHLSPNLAKRLSKYLPLAALRTVPRTLYPRLSSWRATWTARKPEAPVRRTAEHAALATGIRLLDSGGPNEEGAMAPGMLRSWGCRWVLGGWSRCKRGERRAARAAQRPTCRRSNSRWHHFARDSHGREEANVEHKEICRRRKKHPSGSEKPRIVAADAPNVGSQSEERTAKLVSQVLLLDLETLWSH